MAGIIILLKEAEGENELAILALLFKKV